MRTGPAAIVAALLIAGCSDSKKSEPRSAKSAPEATVAAEDAGTKAKPAEDAARRAPRAKRAVPLDGEPPVVAAPEPLCPELGTKEALCACLEKHEAMTDSACHAAGKATGALALWVVGGGGIRDYTEHYYLVYKTDRGYGFASPIGESVDEPYTISQLELASLKVETRGDKRLYRAVVHASNHIEGDFVEDLDEQRLTLCVEEGEAVRCPLTIPIERSYEAELVELEGRDDAEAVAEFRRVYHAAPPLSRFHRLAVAIGEDGKVSVELKSGAKTAELKRYIGEHRLW